MPWFNPVIETVLGKELPGEFESLLFCVQTGIGVGIIAYYMGRFVERKTGRQEKMMKGCCFVRWISRRQLLSN